MQVFPFLCYSLCVLPGGAADRPDRPTNGTEFPSLAQHIPFSIPFSVCCQVVLLDARNGSVLGSFTTGNTTCLGIKVGVGAIACATR